MDLKDLEKLVKLCRKYGIESLKTGQVELKLDLSHSSPHKPSNAAISHPEASTGPVEPPVSQEDMLFWSSGPALSNE